MTPWQLPAELERIEESAQADLAQTGQTAPPYKPSAVLQLAGVATRRGTVRGGAVLIPGRDPHVTVSPILGSAQGREQVAHEAGHVSLGHVKPHAIFEAPAGFRGHNHSKQLEREANLYAAALTMPAPDLWEMFADGAVSLVAALSRFDVPERILKERLRVLDLWRLTYDPRNRTAYRASGWWKITRRPRYLTDLADRQGRPVALCETVGCRRLATVVHHHHYEADGCEADGDLEGLCSQCHYEQHASQARAASWTTA